MTQETTPAPIPAKSGDWARLGTRPFITAKTPVMVRVVVSRRPQVRRCRMYVVETSGAWERDSMRQKIMKAMTPMTSRTMTRATFMAASLPSSLKAVSTVPRETTSAKPPAQSIGRRSSP